MGTYGPRSGGHIPLADRLLQGGGQAADRWGCVGQLLPGDEFSFSGLGR